MSLHRRINQYGLRLAGLHLALVATVFGGALMGLGNAVDGVLNQQDTPHIGHHRHTNHYAAQATTLIPNILPMPAHCMFCIDGVSPQPVSLSLLALSLETRCETPLPALATVTSTAERTTAYRGRAPPHLMS